MKRVYMDWSKDQICPGCGRAMRAKADGPIPGRIVYGAFGFCQRCDKKRKKGLTDMSASYWDGRTVCVGCSRSMVSQRSKVAGHPVHVAKGYCDRCYRRKKNGIALDVPDRSELIGADPVPCPNGCGKILKPNGFYAHFPVCSPGAPWEPEQGIDLFWLRTESVHNNSYAFSKKPNPDSVYIYALLDGSNRVKYIGKTVKTLESRLHGHYGDAYRPAKLDYKIYRWLRSESSGVRIALVGEYSRDLWEIWEKYWISQMLSAGCDLKNTELGGKGGSKIKDAD